MDKDLMMITGEIERLKELALKMDKELFKPVEEKNVNFQEIAELADEASDCINNLMNECMD